jgi:recombination protein RecT
VKTNGADLNEKLKPATTAVAKKPATMLEWLGTVAPRFGQYLPKGMDPDRFMRIVIRSFIQNPRLAQCTKESVIIAVGEAAELGLVPNGMLGHGALIPYRNRAGKSEAQFQIMYKGLLELMYRSQKFLVITADEVCEGDFFDYEKGLNAFLKHKPAEEARGAPTKYYAYYKTTNGGFDFVVMTRAECLAWGEKYSPSWEDKSSAWHTAESEMCKKTVLWRLGKYSPVSVDLPSENPEERPAEAARFADLMRDVIDVETVQTNGNGGSHPEAEPEAATTTKEEKPAPAAEPAATPAVAPAATGPAPDVAPAATVAAIANPRPEQPKPQARRKTVAEMFQHEEIAQARGPKPPAGTRYDPDTGEIKESPKEATEQGTLEIF